MAGPTPVSALIHAATMVTAGVYLIARSNFLFSLAPVAQIVVVVIGALTALFAASIGLKQWDIKKVLAYSTVSQLGYMFVGVGSGAYVAGVFHLVTHAFFKALLFLGSGSVIYAMHAAYHHTGNHDDAQDMRNMGGLQQYMPVTFDADVDRDAGDRRHSAARRLLLEGRDPRRGVRARAATRRIASAHLFGIPGQCVAVSRVRARSRRGVHDGDYMTRMMIYTFHGPNRTGEKEREHLHEAPWIMTGPLVVLGVLTRVRRLVEPAGVRAASSVRSARSITGSSRWSVSRRQRVDRRRAGDCRTSLEYGLVGARGR